MSLTRDHGTRSDDSTTAASPAVEPGKSSRSSGLAVQRKAGVPAPATSTAPAGTASVEAGEDPFGLHLPVQRKGDGPAEGAPAASGSGSALPDGVRTKMESSFGADFSDVRVHEGPQASQMGAVAYAQGTDLHFAPGQFSPGSAAGDALIGHELAHVQQQRAGRVSSPQGKGAPIVADAGLEAEADVAGERAARGEPAGIAGGSGSIGGGAIQRLVGPPAPAEATGGGAHVAERGPDTFGLRGYLEELKAKVGDVSGNMGKFAEAKLGVTSPPIPQLGGGALKIEGEGRYMTNGTDNELEISLHVGVKWGIDLKLFKADVEVFGEGKVKLKAKTGEMLECLGAAMKGVLYDALKMMNVRNCASLASPLAARAAEWAVGPEVLNYDVLTALNWLATSPSVPAWVKDPARETVASMRAFFGSHKGSFEVSAAIGVAGEVGGGANGEGLAGGAAARAVHGISGEAGTAVSDITRRNEFAVEAQLKRGDNEAKVGYVFGGGRTVISLDAAFVTENKFDFDQAKIVSLDGILKLLAAAGLGKAIGEGATAPSGAALVNAVVAGLASGASAIGNRNLPGLKTKYKVSLEVEREGDKPWSQAKVDAKLFLGNRISGEGDAGSLGEVEASAAVGTFITISREVKEQLPAGGAAPTGGQ